MAEIPCQYPGCEFKANNASEAIAIAMFNSHLLSHQGRQANEPPAQKLPPIQRPEIRQDINDEDWVTFLAEWEHFKRCTSISEDRVADHLYMCCERTLARLLIREDPEIISKGENEMKSAIKRLAVIKVATSVRRTNLLASKQNHGETFREFYANVRAAALTCNFVVKCPNICCAELPKVDFTSSVIKDVLIAGIADNDIRKDILGIADLDDKSDKDIVALVEAKEMAMNAYNSTSTLGTTAGAAGVSNYRKESKAVVDKIDQSLKAKLNLKGKCDKCKKDIALYRRFPSGKINRTPFKLCIKCHRDNNQIPNIDSNTPSCQNSNDSSSVSGFFIGSLEDDVESEMGVPIDEEITVEPDIAAIKNVVLNHHIFTPDGWKRASNLAHPTLRLQISTNSNDFENFKMPHPKICPKQIDVVVDSGAQSCLWSRTEFLRMGFNMDDLIPVHHSMKAANTAPIRIDGATFIRLCGQSKEKKNIEAAVMVYISPDARNFYLSREAMIQLGIVSHDFPQVGAAAPTSVQSSIQAIVALPPSDPKIADCGCLVRELPPAKPKSLPFQCVPENNSKMRSWLLDRYAASTFNKCPHQQLPAMEGPPIQIHVDPNAKPVCLTKPAPIPLHWQERVEEELNRDVAMGVLERVPFGEATTWCFRLVITRKEDGGPRRTVDISPLNKYCEREVHASKSPFNLARSVPAGSVKSVFDAWNGYHSVPVREEDRHLTTFTTPWGLFRYKRAPQGFLSSGDGYNRRFDAIVAHISRLERCVDDSLLHDLDLEDH